MWFYFLTELRLYRMTIIRSVDCQVSITIQKIRTFVVFFKVTKPPVCKGPDMQEWRPLQQAEFKPSTSPELTWCRSGLHLSRGFRVAGTLIWRTNGELEERGSRNTQTLVNGPFRGLQFRADRNAAMAESVCKHMIPIQRLIHFWHIFASFEKWQTDPKKGKKKKMLWKQMITLKTDFSIDEGEK